MLNPASLPKVAVLVSGGGTNLQALIDAHARGEMPSCELSLVVSNREAAYALERAADAGIEALTITRPKGTPQADFEAALLAALRERGIELVVLAGFLAILSEDFVRAYPDRIVNVHPSLIPAFCGKGFYGLKVHQAALERGVQISGATVHLVNEIPDGGRILMQKAVRVLRGDTPETLQRRIMERCEWVLLPRCVEALCKQIIRERSRK